jgi:bifunctional polynucleotide phosphatase/kinase
MSKKDEKTNAIEKLKVHESLKWSWFQQKTCVFGNSENVKHSAKIASFDMDDTLLRTKSGAKFAKDAKDWIFWHESVPKKMK